MRYNNMLHTLKIIALSLLLACSAAAQANWNEAWTGRAKVAIQPQGLSASVADVPVVLRLHTGNFDFLAAKDDGSDLRFIAADDKTELKYHIEKYDAVNELAVVWVQLPKVEPAEKDAHFWIYYGNEAAPAVADAKVGWDAATAAAFHFSEKSLMQSAAGDLDATGEIAVQKAALLGEAAVFSGKALSIGATPMLKLNSAGGFSYSAWIKPAALPQQAVLYQQGTLALKIEGQRLALISGSTVLANSEIKAAAWQHVAATIEGAKVVLYLDGKPVGTGDVSVADAQSEVKIGEGYVGEMDELQLASVARSADWVVLAASGQGADSRLLAVQSAESEGGEDEGGEASYMGILINSLTLDAEIVIGILAVMFAISVGVMVAKARLVSSTDKDNRQFLSRFQGSSHDLLALDKGVNLPNSTLFKLYMAGLREIRKREKDGEALALSGASMDAIKAAIDADLVRESQRINAKMVLLTIAISGGPFLGLLGTVVGVMITFAAIAAAGDVNVNAIAPGIAAALLATVAGLGVAIPALFGYNYLASRIKNITIEMQIFVDEFVTRVAELHGK